MPHLSSKKLKEEMLFKIQWQFFESVAAMKNKKRARLLLSELFTPTERVMLSKRFAAILMLSQDIPAYRVWNTLKLSPSTTTRLSLNIERHKYKNLLAAFGKKKEEDVWATIELLLRLGMPEMGKRRWDWLDDIER